MRLRSTPACTRQYASVSPLTIFSGDGAASRCGARLLLAALLFALLVCLPAAGFAAIVAGTADPTAGSDRGLDSWVPSETSPAALTLHGASLYIDVGVPDGQVLAEAVVRQAVPGQFHLFSHGRPGELLIDGQWLDARGIAAKIGPLPGDVRQLNLYGCDFARGEKGKAAVAYLETALGVSIAASEDITGKDGNWDLEVGGATASLAPEHYDYSLADTDGDGIDDAIDFDDDNDGILDTVEGFCTPLATTSSSYSVVRTTQDATVFLTVGPTAGFSVPTDTSAGTHLSFTSATTREESLDSGDNASSGNHGTISELEITVNLDPSETPSSISLDLDTGVFDDGLYLEVNGTVISFDQTDWDDRISGVTSTVNAQFGNSTVCTGTCSSPDWWEPWQGEGDPELVLDVDETGVLTVQLLVTSDNEAPLNGARVDILPYMDNYPYPSVTGLDFTAGVKVGISFQNGGYGVPPVGGPGGLDPVTATFDAEFCSVVDTDGDGISDHLDLDSDNDGILDMVEAGHGAADTDGDGRIDGGVGTDGILDSLQAVADDEGVDYTVSGSDSDSVKDFRDLDSDNDGIPDNIEGQSTSGYIAPTSFTDTDGDGIIDLYDTQNLGAGNSGFTPQNSDSSATANPDTIPDYLDWDSDGDLRPDSHENDDTDNVASGTDTDGDGIDDAFDDDINNWGSVNDGIDPVVDLPDSDGDCCTTVLTSDVDYRDVGPTAVTIGEAALEGVAVSAFLDGIGAGAMDAAALLGLLAVWDADLARAYAGAGRDQLLQALADYLDPDSDGVVAVLRWDTLEQYGTIGFYVERQQGVGDWVRINGRMLPALIAAPMGAEYRLADPGARPGTSYRYRLIEQEATGGTRIYGPYDLEMPQ